jgi:hypothetical protein
VGCDGLRGGSSTAAAATTLDDDDDDETQEVSTTEDEWSAVGAIPAPTTAEVVVVLCESTPMVAAGLLLTLSTPLVAVVLERVEVEEEVELGEATGAPSDGVVARETEFSCGACG